MKLYFSPGACSLSPHIVLREAGFEPQLAKVDLGTKKLDGGGDFLAVNAKGYVPVLELDSGERLTEGPAIVQYIADQKPESGLAPKAGTMERVRLQEWLNFISTEIHKAFSPLFGADTPDAYKDIARKRLGQRFDWLSKQLEGKPFLMGDRFTAADAYLFTVLGWCPFVGMTLDNWPVLKEYRNRISARPAVRAALKAEGLAK